MNLRTAIAAYLRQRHQSPSSRSDAMAALCERLVHEFGANDASAAEIRVIVRKRNGPNSNSSAPGGAAIPAPATRPGESELLWELRRLLAWSGGTLADVADVLESRAANLDEHARALLQDEVFAIEGDIAALKALLAGPVDWDAAYEDLLSGEVPPFHEHAADDDEHDGPVEG